MYYVTKVKDNRASNNVLCSFVISENKLNVVSGIKLIVSWPPHNHTPNEHGTTLVMLHIVKANHHFLIGARAGTKTIRIE